jgi:hypothetical protein
VTKESKFAMTELGNFADLDVANKKQTAQDDEPKVKTTVVLNKETWLKLKIIAATEQVSLSDLLQEGAAVLVKHRGT